MSLKRPMKGEAVSVDQIADIVAAHIDSHWIVQPKIDGWRGTVQRESSGLPVALASSLKPIPNEFVRDILGRNEFVGLDGEIVVGPSTAPDVFKVTDKALKTRTGRPMFTFIVFDDLSVDGPYHERLLSARERARKIADDWDDLIEPIFCPVMEIDSSVSPLFADRFRRAEAIREKGAEYLDLGFEGFMLKRADGEYKAGRSTVNQALCLKIKPFVDAEAVVVGMTEMERNGNEARIGANGLTERSSHKANQRAGGTMGALVCREIATGLLFKTGTGFSKDDRDEWWTRRDDEPTEWELADGTKVKGYGICPKCRRVEPLITFKHLAYGRDVAPRIPVYKGERSRVDMTDY